MVELVSIAYRTIEKADDSDPYGRGEPDSILALLTACAVESDGYSAYLGASRDDGDASDNGNYILTTERRRWDLTNRDGDPIQTTIPTP